MIDELIFLSYAMFGAFIRAAYGVYRAYSNYEKFELSWRRIFAEFFFSMAFGLFGAMVLNGMGMFKFASNIMAILAGLGGANLIDFIAKKLGLGSKLQVNVVEKIPYPDLNLNQQRAMEYLKREGKINAKIYKTMNETSRSCTKWELLQMIEKGYIKKVGHTKASYYKLRFN